LPIPCLYLRDPCWGKEIPSGGKKMPSGGNGDPWWGLEVPWEGFSPPSWGRVIPFRGNAICRCRGTLEEEPMRSYRTAIDRKRIQWEEMTGRLGGLLDRLPYLRVPHGELVRKIADSRKLEGEAIELRVRLNEALQRLEETAREGERLRGRLTLALKAEYGVDNQRLGEFGLKARRPRGRNKKSAKGGPAK